MKSEESVSSRESSSKSAVATASQMTPLADDFEPGPDDVICGRGKKCYNHIGNERFRQRVITFLDEYSASKTKLDKSTVLSKVVEQVRQISPKGGFVKQDSQGRWHEVGDFLAREKTSQAFRDALHDRYKSSNISKKKRRQEEQARAAKGFTQSLRSDYDISPRLERISNEVLGPGISGLEGFSRPHFDLLRSTRRVPNVRDLDSRRHSDTSYRYTQQQARRYFPDPLFGSSMNTSNVMPGERIRRQLHSNINALAGSQGEPAYGEQSEQKIFNSSLPEFSFNDKDIFPDESGPLYHSAPELAYFPVKKSRSRDSSDDDEKKPAAKLDAEPIPWQQIRFQPSLKGEPEKDAPMKMEEIPSSSTASAYTGSGRISKDLMECLDKMTYHSIADDNVFDPIPLSPQSNKNYAKTRGKVAKVAAAELFDPLDESERDEFAEG